MQKQICCGNYFKRIRIAHSFATDGWYNSMVSCSIFDMKRLSKDLVLADLKLLILCFNIFLARVVS